VSFDIDANGILTVTAKDKESGKEQKITISGSTQLTKEDIDRMVADAQAHSDEDRKRREEIEARNAADSMAYQVERQLRDLGDRVPMNEKARAEQLISQIRELVKNNSTDVARLRQLTSDLQQVAYGLTSAASAQEGAGARTDGGGGRSEGPPPSAGGNDDVIDAEFKQT
jgi:molecular chaperone DnaK